MQDQTNDRIDEGEIEERIRGCCIGKKLANPPNAKTDN